MNPLAIDAPDRAFMTTDDLPFGFAAVRPAVSDGGMDAVWAELLQGELEEAVDAVLLRAAFARTLTLSGGNHHLFV